MTSSSNAEQADAERAETADCWARRHTPGRLCGPFAGGWRGVVSGRSDWPGKTEIPSLRKNTAEFTAALSQLLADAADQKTAIMCSETLWWRCHRRLIADHCVLLDSLPVSHLMPGAKLVPHVPTARVRVHRGHLQYDLPVDESVG
ncbi:DUF488 family protein [Paenarthrobacter sp. 2TAF44]|uniref:DUF488 family protein n=1 Tax=Paenarthrobacter sp. 2TAF44 TaxID=3233018 RepID=UPI003F9D36FE